MERFKIKKTLGLNGSSPGWENSSFRGIWKKNFSNYHIFNFEKNKNIHVLFETQKDPNKILEALSLIQNNKIDASKDLIIFDEIQACPEALTSLKYFSESLQNSYICAAGSLLGLHFGKSSFPVGKIDFLKVYPFNFEEFITACGHKDLYLNYLEQPNLAIHEILWSDYVSYLITGGLPEFINVFLNYQNHDSLQKFDAVRKTQENLVLGYLADMAKHCGKENAMFLETLWRNSAEQLGQEKSSKYEFKGVFPGKRSYQDFQNPIDWLKKAGLLYQIPLIDGAKIPLSLQKKENFFKLFIFDVGIMNCLTGLSWQQLINYDFNHKGFIAENFVLQELMSSDLPLQPIYTYKSGMSEIEFLLDFQGKLLPIEVKAGKNLKAKSLSVFRKKYKPPKALRLSQRLLNLDGHALDRILQDWPLFLTLHGVRSS